MQDSVNAAALMPGCDLYAGYVDGRYANLDAIHKRFPGKTVVSITVTGEPGAHVCDCETGDLTPPHAAAWAQREVQARRHPTIYCDTSTRPSVETECSKLGLALRRDYEIWEAHYDNVAQLPDGAVAKQYADHGPDGENVDRSVVADFWHGVDPTPTAPAKFVYRRPLRQGMWGSNVVNLKRRLRWLGYGGFSIMPAFGPGLTAAVKRFQRDHHLTPDGVVGPLTARALNQ